MQIKNILDGDCPKCRGKLQEIILEYQPYTHRILCLDCKICGDDFTFGRAYNRLIAQCGDEVVEENKYKTFFRLTEQANKILEADIFWDEKYKLIFSTEISKKIFALDLNLDYYDPDSTYEDDVCAFMRAVNEKVETLKKVEGIDTF